MRGAYIIIIIYLQSFKSLLTSRNYDIDNNKTNDYSIELTYLPQYENIIPVFLSFITMHGLSSSVKKSNDIHFYPLQWSNVNWGLEITRLDE